MHPVRDVPEIILFIGENLTQHSLTICLRVCKSWHQLLAPLLYKSISGLCSRLSVEGMARHAEHIRYLGIQICEGAGLVKDGIPLLISHPSVRCRNLWTLHIMAVDHRDRNSVASCEALILLNQQLRHLNICNGSTNHHLAWSILFPQCSPFLQSLTLTASRLNKKETALLMELGRRLTKLELRDCHLSWSDFTVEPQFPVMEDLLIDSVFNDVAQELCWSAQCPQLRVLTWTTPQVHREVFSTRLAFRTLQNRPWQQLKSLELTGKLSDSQVARILDACGPLRIVSLKQSGLWYRSLAALERHSQTLEGLRLYDCDGLRSWMCQWITVTFPKLTHLKLGRVFAHDMVTGPRAEEARANQLAQDARDDIEQRQQEVTNGTHEMVDELNEIRARFAASRDIREVKPWVCLSLIQLTMFIAFPVGEETTGWDEQIFQQISKLGRLEALNLGQSVYNEDHSIHGGDNTRGLQLKIQSGLTLLAPLRNMVTLKFVGTHQRVDEEDLLWILNQWPYLKSMSRGLLEDKDACAVMWQMVEDRGIELLLRSNEFSAGSDDENEDDENFDSDFAE